MIRTYPYWQVFLAFCAIYWTAGGLATFIILMTPAVGRKKKKKWPIAVVVLVFLCVWMFIDRYYAPGIYPSDMGFWPFIKKWIAHKMTFQI